MKNYKILGENIGENLYELWLRDEFLDAIPKAQSMKGKIDMLNILKIYNFCSAKDTVKKMKDRMGENIAKHISFKGLVSKYTKNF